MSTGFKDSIAQFLLSLVDNGYNLGLLILTVLCVGIIIAVLLPYRHDRPVLRAGSKKKFARKQPVREAAPPRP